RIERLRAGHVTLQLPQRPNPVLIPGRVAVYVDGRRRVAVDRERRLATRKQRGEVRVDLADLVRRARRHDVEIAVRVSPVAVVRDAAGEVVVLVCGDDEQRVVLVDPVLLQTLEEGPESVVV